MEMEKGTVFVRESEKGFCVNLYLLLMMDLSFLTKTY